MKTIISAIAASIIVILFAALVLTSQAHHAALAKITDLKIEAQFERASMIDKINCAQNGE